MSSTDIVRRQGGELERPAGARQLGVRKKPIIRLGMGHKHPEKGYPVKDDHFTIRGDERAIAKFKEAYGDTPKAVKIMVPSSLALALDISYRSFIGGNNDDGDGGRPLALGMTNFATLGYAGGPDVLRVWKQDGTFAEVETLGLDELGKPLDEIAADLKIAIHTTFTFTIPDVLGWGSFAAITSKGKKTADNLAFALGEIYSAFGPKAPWAFDRDQPPLLVIKPDTALMRFEKDGIASWGKTKIFVLDIVIPEPFEDMRDRIIMRQHQLAPAGAQQAMYGDRPELTAGDALAGKEPAQQGPSSSPPEGQNAANGDAHPDVLSAASDPEDWEFGAPGPDANPELEALAEMAALYDPKSKKYPGKTLGEILALGDEGTEYIKWCLANAKKPEFIKALHDLARVRAPELLQVQA